MDYEEEFTQYFYRFLLKALFGKKLLPTEKSSPLGITLMVIKAG